MQEIRLLIADHSDAFAQDVRTFLGRMPGIHVVGFLNNGGETVEYIMEERPDAVLLELILDGLDGISVLKSLRGMHSPPAVIVCTEFCSEVSIRRARQYGASCFLCKPIARQALYDAIVESVHSIGQSLVSDEPPQYESFQKAGSSIAAFLAESGIPRQSVGYRYLCDAASLTRQNPDILSSVTKQLYPEIARINASTPARVERDIRTAIQHAHRNSNLKIHGERPTNREFIQLLADKTVDSTQPI